MAVPLPCSDGELLAAIMRGSVTSDAETAALERHLAECAQCRLVADLIAGFNDDLLPDLTGDDPEICEISTAELLIVEGGSDRQQTTESTTPSHDDSSDLLIDAIRRGDQDAWRQLVAEYHGRLLAFAKAQVGQESDAEDAVQDTFVGMLKSLDRFRGDASLETWLFQILRRRIADQYRRSGTRREVALVAGSEGDSGTLGEHDRPVAESPSWYVRREEQDAADFELLADAVAAVTGQMKRQKKFRDLIVFDLLFFAGRRNCDVAEAVGLEETSVAVLKHRFLRRVGSQVEAATAVDADSDRGSPPADRLLTQVWESTRPTCPKRSTLGKFVLGTLAEEWDRYIAFHTSELGCRFCAANVDDLMNELDSAEAATESARDRILESTVGFLPGR
ncbi:MAG: RNA polymerase sigma factor [Planctomycetota bacterium]|jgi:RNA polymerase sigma factor (sigma-70 family)